MHSKTLGASTIEVMARTYWLDLFTVETWGEFRAHGAQVSGFSERRWSTVQRMAVGDYLLCYLTVESRWVGVLEVTGKPFWDDTDRIWAGAPYPARVPVQVVVALAPELGIPVLETRNELTVFRELRNPNKWMGPFRGSPTRWKQDDGEAILRLLREAEENPTERPLRGQKRNVRQPTPEVLDDEAGALTFPEDEEAEELDAAAEAATEHTEIQYLLLKLGAEMGFDVYVARSDQSRPWRGKPLGEMPRRRVRLPQQFDRFTNRTIEQIDVLWLDGPAITAAFEVESTTSIYSGLLRMSDLLAMQPNISIPLFLVAPEERRSKVLNEVNRPTFKRRKPPLVDVCRYISFEVLKDALRDVGDNVTFLRPDWLQKISESCEVGDI